MNDIAQIGHNGGPDPIDEINAEFEADRIEAENWTDGAPVENEAQMAVVDKVRKRAREWRLALERGQKSATAPLYDAYKAEGERWKPTIEDAKRIEGALVAAVDGYKRKLAAEKAETKRKAEAEAWAARRAAEDAARSANAADLEAQRTVAEAQREADEAQRRAAAAGRDKVTGLRTVAQYEIFDQGRLLNWIVKNDRAAVVAFIEEWARRNHKTHRDAAGLRVWDEKEAF